MTVRYYESRISYILITLLLVLQAAIIFFCGIRFGAATTILVSLVPLLLFLGFCGMRVIIDDDVIYVVSGVGLTLHNIPFEVISGYDVVPNTYLSWLYDPAQETVLRLMLRDGSSALIPIGEPRRLVEIISGQLRR